MTEFITYFVQYIVPILALGISIFAYNDSRKVNRAQMELNKIEEKLKNYELEENEMEREEATKACVEARVMQISKKNYRMKLWNSGKATAYNVDFIASEKMVMKSKVPFDFLESGKSFEEEVIVSIESPLKFQVTTTWADEQGIPQSKEQIVTI